MYDRLSSFTRNEDDCYYCRANYYTYINLDASDNSGMLRFLTDELQDAEDSGDKGNLLVFRDMIFHLC